MAWPQAREAERNAVQCVQYHRLLAIAHRSQVDVLVDGQHRVQIREQLRGAAIIDLDTERLRKGAEARGVGVGGRVAIGWFLSHRGGAA